MGDPNENDFVLEGLSEDEVASLEAMDADPEASSPSTPEESETPVEAKPAEPEQVQQPEPDKQVNLAALQESRAENRELRQKFARLEERTDLLLQQLQRPKEASPEEPKLPSKEEDPFGYSLAMAEKASQTVEKFEAEREQERQQVEAIQQEFSTNRDTVRAFEAKIAEDNADTTEAMDMANHVTNVIAQGLQQQGYQGDGLKVMLARELAQQSTNAMHDPQGPTNYLGRLAAFYGYQPKPAQPDPKAELEKAQADVADQAARRDAHMSLSNMEGAETPKEITARDVANMSDAQFNKLMATKEGQAKVEQLMGTA